MTIQRRHIPHLIAAVFLIGLASAGQVVAAEPSTVHYWEFHNIPVTNACDRWSLIPAPPTCAPLNPGGAAVYNCTVWSMIGLRPLGGALYVPDQTVVLDPPKVCYFHGCNLLTMTMTCIDPDFDGDVVKLGNVSHYRFRKQTDLPLPEVPNQKP